MYYECHVTYLDNATDTLNYPGWKPSRIDGDPILGDGVKSYFTKHYSARISMDDMKNELAEVVKFLLTNNKKVLRSKIELVVYDNVIGR